LRSSLAKSVPHPIGLVVLRRLFVLLFVASKLTAAKIPLSISDSYKGTDYRVGSRSQAWG
jgi:hypothetical protein